MKLRAPEPLAEDHDIQAFGCGVHSLDEWLKRRAGANQTSGASRTFVVAVERRVVGYYALASGAVAVTEAVGRFRRNMPDPIPVVILARLAVDASMQGHGLGRALFRDAGLRILHAADAIGIRGVLVHAISEDARRFYSALGFVSSPLNPLTLMVTVADLRTSLGGAADR